MPPLLSSTAMATSISPSSSPNPPASLPPKSTAVSRRLPPPCWSHDETVALIDSYRHKWYSLRRGNLRAPHWQEVADGVADRCPLSNPPKTSIQCRHKMEKLRKRYRSEIQRISDTPRGHRFPSSWVHFKLMDSMELGSSSSNPPANQDEEEEAEEEEEEPLDEDQDELLLYPKGIKQQISLPPNRRYQGFISNRNRTRNGNVNGNGVRIKIPNIADVQPPPLQSRLNLYNNHSSSFDDYPPSMNPQYGLGRGLRNGNRGMKRREEKMENNDGNSNSNGNGNVMDEMVAAIHKLGDGFEKMERMKMDVARELESMRMKSEMKRTEMIIESQQKLVDSFSETVMEKKKNKRMKRMPSPES